MPWSYPTNLETIALPVAEFFSGQTYKQTDRQTHIQITPATCLATEASGCEKFAHGDDVEPMTS